MCVVLGVNDFELSTTKCIKKKFKKKIGNLYYALFACNAFFGTRTRHKWV